jgi:hypothetical protein
MKLLLLLSLCISVYPMDVVKSNTSDSLAIQIQHIDAHDHSHPMSITIKDLEAGVSSSSGSSSHKLRKRDQYVLAGMIACSAICSATITAGLAAIVAYTQCK